MTIDYEIIASQLTKYFDKDCQRADVAEVKRYLEPAFNSGREYERNLFKHFINEIK